MKRINHELPRINRFTRAGLRHWRLTGWLFGTPYLTLSEKVRKSAKLLKARFRALALLKHYEMWFLIVVLKLAWSSQCLPWRPSCRQFSNWCKYSFLNTSRARRLRFWSRAFVARNVLYFCLKQPWRLPTPPHPFATLTFTRGAGVPPRIIVKNSIAIVKGFE